MQEIDTLINPPRYSRDILQRINAIIYRLLSNLKKKDAPRQSWNRQALNALDLQNAENIWIRLFQMKFLLDELNYLQSKKKAWRPAPW
jgi:hypothetical protein